MMSRRLLAAAVLAVAAGLAGYAGLAQTRTTQAGEYIAAGSVDLMRLLPPPPASGSGVTRAEIDELLRIQASRTPADCERAAADRDAKLSRFMEALGLPATVSERDLPRAESELSTHH